MSTDPILAPIVSVLDDLKTEIASLRSGLHAAEERIARIERATFTPSTPSRSPTPTSLPSVEDHDIRPTPLRDDPEILEPGDTCLKREPSNEYSSEIRRQLKPVTDALVGVAAQLSRIEKAISPAVPKHDATAEEPKKRPQEIPRQAEPFSATFEDSPISRQLRYPQANLPTAFKARYSFVPSPQQSARPVFGHPSTPRRRIVSLDVTGSPFSNYCDERSPFSRLANTSGRSSSTLWTT